MKISPTTVVPNYPLARTQTENLSEGLDKWIACIFLEMADEALLQVVNANACMSHPTH